ncbi:hypothetical protein [Archaeoglobus veneficus]|uniref:Uncharacterized protein n=1 Tax=Archaeoglobus veneficus (strain DSM 11195 / SNP6) TaxID=693661 RepID=F2KTD4_ARCVS|nr:hypothetical protein [Archaeoglobus veneficus]AEA47164.1 hypothetical protein Arcve_1156 [Archaeoglobus veneficus SNP6]
MGSSILDILIRDPNFPCAPYRRTGHQFYVDIMHCDGSFLEWKGIKYRKHKLAQRIHDQVEVPPGCYVVRGYAPCGNVVTQTTVVEVCCNEVVCVNLLATSPRFCFVTARLALRPELLPNVPREFIERADAALKEVVEFLPKEIHEPSPNLVEELLKAEECEKREYPKKEE